VVARSRRRPGPPARLAIDHAEQRPDRHIEPAREPRLELIEAPVVHADLAPLATLALANQDRAASRVEVWFCQRHRCTDPEACPPEHDDQCS
jgi:hypothetical protein